MSYVFEYGDETVWSPALRVGELYVTLAEALAAMLSVPSGLSAMASDYYEVDRDQFTAFIAVLRDWVPGSHAAGGALLGGFLTTSLVLVQRMGAVLDVDAETGAAVAALAASMAV